MTFKWKLARYDDTKKHVPFVVTVETHLDIYCSFSSLSRLQKMVNELTNEEQETAARTSYAYWTASELKQNGPPSDNVRIRMAMREARRHLVGEGSYDKGLAALRACCEFRKVSQMLGRPWIHVLCSCVISRLDSLATGTKG